MQANILSYWWWGGNPDEVNAITGLTRREVHAVKKSWETLFKDNVTYGSELFIRLFRLDNESKQAFRMLKNLSEEELRISFQFKAHVINVMTSLDLGFKNLNQPEIVVVMMNKLGESHGKRNIRPEKFLHFKEVLKEVLQEQNLDQFTLQAWEKTIDFTYKHIFENLTH